MQDSISDLFNRIRMGQQRQKIYISIFFSIKLQLITQVLKVEGYIKDYVIEKDQNNKQILKIYLKYFECKPVITKLIQVSKQSSRVYCKYRKLPIILNGLGVAIISTSKGIMSNEKAKSFKLGGEYLGYVE